MKKIFYFVLLLAHFTAFAQSPKAEKAYKPPKMRIKKAVANMMYNQFRYMEAIRHFEQILKKDSLNMDIKEKLAHSYRKINDSKNAEKWYFEIANNFDNDSAYQNIFYYAQALAMNEKYEESREWYQVYSQMFNLHTDSLGHYYIEAYESVEDFYRDSIRYDIKLAPFNSKNADFSPEFHNKGIVFCSNRTPIGWGDKTFEWNETSFLDLYFANKEDSVANLFHKEFNGLYHEGPTAFFDKSDSVVITRNNYSRRKAKTSEDGTTKLKLFFAHEQADQSWSRFSEFPYNSDEYSTGHPALSTDNTTLYFASDMPGGYGGTDIWRSTFENGKWQKPENMGNEINTPANEMFPFLDQNNDLYYASNGLAGLGGLDIFLARNYNGTFGKPENMGYPVNSSQDDFGIILQERNGEGYFSSNRPSVFGDDDIYWFKIYPKEIVGIAINTRTNLPIDSVTFQIKELVTKHPLTFVRDNAKNFRYLTSLRTDYDVLGKKQGFTDGKLVVNQLEISKMKHLDTVYLYMEPDEPEPITYKSDTIKIENVFYDFDKNNIRRDAAQTLDELIETLKNNSKMRLLLSSHCDSRASNEYNVKLSLRRSRAAFQYLVDRGIDPSRMEISYFGEYKLQTDCPDNVDCTETAHQMNRRTEVILLSR